MTTHNMQDQTDTPTTANTDTPHTKQSGSSTTTKPNTDLSRRNTAENASKGSTSTRMGVTSELENSEESPTRDKPANSKPQLSQTDKETAESKAAKPTQKTETAKPTQAEKATAEAETAKPTKADSAPVEEETEIGESTLILETKSEGRIGEISEEQIRRRLETHKYRNTDHGGDDNPNWGSARFTPQMILELKVRDTGERYTFKYGETDEITMGRKDPTTGELPTIDLTEQGAQTKGVSRQHAVIKRKDNTLSLLDLGSPNGSFLNGQRLISQQSRILRDGDDIRLGHLVLRVTFRVAPPTSRIARRTTGL